MRITAIREAAGTTADNGVNVRLDMSGTPEEWDDLIEELDQAAYCNIPDFTNLVMTLARVTRYQRKVWCAR